MRGATGAGFGGVPLIVLLSMIPRVAAAQQCPPLTHLDRVEQHGNVRTVHCKCNAGYQARNGRCETIVPPQTVPNLARDADVARLSAAQLDVVNRRIAGLQRAIVLLSDDNPEWGRERDRLLDETHEDAIGLSFEAFNLVTLGIAKWSEIAARLHVDELRSQALSAALKEPLARLPAEEERLKRVMGTTRDPAVTKAILEYVAVLHRLRSAEHSEKLVEMAKRAYEACELLRSEMELMKEKTSADKAANALYVSSAVLGGVAVIFVADGPPAVAAAAGSFGSSLAVGGRELVNLWEERQRLRTLDRGASAREAMRHELMQRVGALQEERGRLTWAVERAR
jgi:hypothetical protein